MIDRTLKVIRVNDYEAVTAMTVEDIIETVIPARSFLPTAKLTNPLEKRLVEQYRELHALIQRDFAGEKKTNARGNLASYIKQDWLRGDRGEPAAGFFGPVIIWFPEKLHFPENGDPAADGAVKITSKGIFVDGESRGEAFLVNIDPDEERLSNREIDELLKRSVAVHVIHGIKDPKVIAKYFADVNGKAVRVNPNLVAMADYTDPYAEIAKRVFDRLGLELETRQRQVRAKSEAVMTGLQARLMVAAMAKGVGVVQYGAKSIPSDGVDFEKLEAAAESWLKQVFEAFEPARFRDKEQVLRSVPVTASLGALGSGFYQKDTESQRKALDVLSDEIDWTVGKHWNDIAGRVNPTTEKFTVGGAKQFAHATYRALTDPDNASGKKIRHVGPPVEDAA